MSPNLSRLCKTFKWRDSYSVGVGNVSVYSHYYKQGATWIDREYNWGDITVKKSEYFPIAFSDHMGLLTEVDVPFHLQRADHSHGPRSFKIRNSVATDPFFKNSIANSMSVWKEIKESGLDSLTWWEIVVKPGIRKIALARSKEMVKERRGHLNMLFIRQAYIMKKLQANNCVTLHAELKVYQPLNFIQPTPPDISLP